MPTDTAVQHPTKSCGPSLRRGNDRRWSTTMIRAGSVGVAGYLLGSLPCGQRCFACGPDNQNGMHLPFELVGETVEAVFTLDEEFSGAPTFVHGGLVMTILDEAMAWAAIAVRERFAVTTEFTSSFVRPVRIGEEHIVRAIVGPIEDDGRTLTLSATITRSDGKECALAQGTYVVLTEEQADATIGSTADGKSGSRRPSTLGSRLAPS